MAEEQRPPGWWNTIPGLLTAMAGFISALAALILALKQAEFLGNGDEPTTEDPPEQTTDPPTAAAAVLDGTTRKALARARSLLPQRGPSPAAAIFADALRGKAYYTIVVRDNCDSTKVGDAIATVPESQLIVLPLPGTGCYRVGWGLYKNAAAAASVQRKIGDRLRQPDSAVDGRVRSVSVTLMPKETETASEPPTKVRPEKTTEPPAATGQVAAPPRGPAPVPDDTTRQALARARSLVPQRGPSPAAAIFADALRDKAYYTIVVRDNCDSITVRNAIFSVPNSELIVLPLPGTDCYRVGWGLYENKADADAVRRNIGAKLAQLDAAIDGRVESVAATLQWQDAEKRDEPTTKDPPGKTTEPPPATGQVAAPPGDGKPAPALDDTTRKVLARARSLIPGQEPSKVAAIFADALRGKPYYTIVVRDNCDSTKVGNAISAVPNSELIVLPLPGTGCYRVGWGLYDNEAEADAVRRRIGDKLARLDSVTDGRVESVAATLQGQDTAR